MNRTTLGGLLALSLTLGSSRPAAIPPQKPEAGWGVTRVQPHDVSRIYWELQQTMEVLVRLAPIGQEGKPARLNLVLQAFFPGRAQRDPYSGLPQWPRGSPARIAITAQAHVLTHVIPGFTLRLVADDRAFDLTRAAGRFRLIPCMVATDDCSPNGVEADLEPAVLRALVNARSIRGDALGLSIELTDTDRRALAGFAERINLPVEMPPPGDR